MSKNGTNDPVNHPNHYISQTGLESIDVIKSFTEGLEGFEAVATANALKYMMRWKHKNGIQDLEKARWYINALIVYLEEDEEDANDRVCVNDSVPGSRSDICDIFANMCLLGGNSFPGCTL